MWRSEDNFPESILSPYHVDPGDTSQIVRLGGRCLYPISQLVKYFKKFNYAFEGTNMYLKSEVI